MSILTEVPLHLYAVMLGFSVTIGLLVAIVLRDARRPTRVVRSRSEPVKRPPSFEPRSAAM